MDNIHRAIDMLCVFLLSFHSVLNRNPAISSSDSSVRESFFFFFSSLVNKRTTGLLHWKRGWSMMVYCPMNPSFQINIPWSTSFPSQCTIESMVYWSYLSNLINASWLSRISLGLWASKKRWILWINNNQHYYYYWIMFEFDVWPVLEEELLKIRQTLRVGLF